MKPRIRPQQQQQQQASKDPEVIVIEDSDEEQDEAKENHQPGPIPVAPEGKKSSSKAKKIHDPEAGTSCHQCRQKTIETMASCKNGSCRMNFCPKCLRNRYGEEVANVRESGAWKCPRCRNVCNCSQCMKRKGCSPTGILSHLSKSVGCASVAEFLTSTQTEELQKTRNEKSRPVRNYEDEENSSGRKRKRVLADAGICNVATVRRDREADLSAVGNLNRKAEQGDGERQKQKKKYEHLLDGAGSSKVAGEPGLPEGHVRPSKKKSKRTASIAEKGDAVDDRHVELCIDFGIPEDAKKLNATVRQGKVANLSGERSVDRKAGEKKRKREHKHLLAEASSIKLDLPRSTPKKKPKKNISIAEECNAKDNDLDIPEVDDQHKSAMQPEIVLPDGEKLESVAGTALSRTMIGPALQLLEFCCAFQKLLCLRDGQAEDAFQEILQGLTSQRGPLVHLYVKLLSFMSEDADEGSHSRPTRSSWFESLKEYLSRKSPQPDISVESDIRGYEELDSGKKLQLLNDLCDDCLSTPTFREFMEKSTTEKVQPQEAKDEVAAARKKARAESQRLKEAEAKRLLVVSETKGSFLLTSEQREILLTKTRIREERAAAAQMSLAELICKSKTQQCNAQRTEPVTRVGSRIFWKLRGVDKRSTILVQDISGEEECWSRYSQDEADILVKFMATESVKVGKERPKSLV